MVRFILGCASVGYAKTRKEILGLVQIQVDTHGWWNSFCKRNPNLTFRTPAPLSLARATAVDEDALGRYFDLLERTLEDNGLPCQIFNLDETGMPLSPQSPKCVFARGEKTPANIDGGDKAQITVVACVSAAGYCIPPMVIWDRKKLSLELTAGEVPGTLSDKGWMDQELFYAWLSCHFLRYAPSTRPLLLLLDGHSSHYSPHAIRFAAKEKVILPPHTTHVTQPLDRGCFSPLKMAWREVCHTFMAENPGKRVTRFNFPQLTIKNIVGGFRVTGVYPINRHVVEKSKELSKPTLSEATGLAYTPLYSPAKVSSCAEARRHTEFSGEELERFECRYENGYDLTTDERYNMWLHMYHPDECHDAGQSSSFSEDQVVMSERQRSDWQKLLTVPDPIPTRAVKPKQTARVITGPEFLQQVREKELKMKEEALERKLAGAKYRAEALEKKSREQEERRRKANTRKITRSRSIVPEAAS